ncbi:hypothetical protein L4174_004595 [Photobacterium sp. CCB-ST2H9]|uniref:Uncharacterized protein n=1 Tax=Photobacterium galatheae TaxID=1654360 RepID=A0A066RZH5_9GAMM|nr:MULTISPECIES: hypothetical protein [Photobacterium]KDM93097.1 hypothetical protein EA58_02595 [Photobacterium galatheae]MCM0148375.1 hypothetical protein [Photobacterium galatheae]UTM58130.1 hypothetical protein L4174_004595 [Photobacterium sp. CCB-ST2H9]
MSHACSICREKITAKNQSIHSRLFCRTCMQAIHPRQFDGMLYLLTGIALCSLSFLLWIGFNPLMVAGSVILLLHLIRPRILYRRFRLNATMQQGFKHHKTV